VSQSSHKRFVASVFDAQFGGFDGYVHIIKKRALHIEVEVVDEVIQIRRPDPMQNQDDCIEVSAEQVDQLIGWLKEAQAKLQGTHT
jgi:hypothetical protein